MDEILEIADSSFKYILLAFNLMTFVVIYLHKKKQKKNKQHHVLFVTAHPDDEVMFFRPSIKSIASDYFVHLLCLSGGSSQRQAELKQSATLLKLHKVECLQNQKLKDSLQTNWDKQQILLIIQKYVKQNQIKAIFTFDQHGVSNHVNHKSIFQALRSLHYEQKQLKILQKKVTSLTQNEKQKVEHIKQNSIKIYHLRTVSIIRKYTGFLQILFALIRDYSWININIIDAYTSMAIHKSQFVWYRKLWTIFSQYSYINVFWMTRIKLSQSKKQLIQENSQQSKKQN